MKQFCEYCGSANSYHAFNCRSCGAPFTIRTVVKEDVKEENLNVTVNINDAYIDTQISNTMASLLPIIIFIYPILWFVQHFRGDNL